MAERQILRPYQGKLALPILPAIHSVRWKPYLILFFSGVNLMLIQWVMVREITTLLLGTELVVLLTAVSYFAGISIGYRLSGRVKRAWLPALGCITLGVHLTLPVTVRVLVVALGNSGLYWAAFLALPLLIPFVVSAFYSVFLPHFADNGDGGLGPLYMTELLGSMCGVGVLVFLADLGLSLVYLIYIISVIALLLALGVRRVIGTLLTVASLLWLAALPNLNQWSNELWYTTLLGFPENTRVLHSAYSPYQKVDVLELPDGERALYLDGLSHFNGAFGNRLNVVVGEVPAALVKPQNSLVIGAGVMQTEQMLAQDGGWVTTVEIDPIVADVGARLFYQYNDMDKLSNRIVVVDDAKHFLATTETRYDLIVADTPAAFSVQPATLYSASFYQSIRDHLTEDGIFVGNMTSEFIPGDTISRRVAASVLQAFDEVIVVTPASVGWSFIFAADDLPFTRNELDAALRASGEVQLSSFDSVAVRLIVGDAMPITLDSMDFVLQTSFEWIVDRLHWGKE